MQKVDAQEAAGIVQRMMAQLMTTVPASGVSGSQARTAIGDVKDNAYILLRADALGLPLNNAFLMAVQNGATFSEMEFVRRLVALETPRTVGGVLVQNCGIELCLASESEIIANTAFVSRQDVQAVKDTMAQPFNDAIEIAADEMDQETFQGEIALYAALTNHLVSTARPLPRMLAYQFAVVLPTLVIAHRLYADASRADQIRQENRIVHPLFCPATGNALSA
jgi:prophage DNA circulation protein